MTRLLSLLALLFVGCPSTPTPEDVGGGSDAPGRDVPGLDAPGLDAPGLDAPGLDAPGPCSLTEAECGGTCIDVQEDEANCGGCGLTCEATETCLFGTCQPATCPAGTDRCSGACVDTAVDSSHCGTCDHACADGEVCEAGSCVSACPAPGTVCENEGVSICTDTDTDPDHCGACGMPCAAGLSCAGGACVCRGRNTELCGGTCVDTTRDHENCGACGRVCVRGACSAGACTCRVGATLCGGTNCVDLNTNPLHCGVCGRVCGRGANCVAGSCVASSCPSTSTLCGGSCVDLQTDEANCGACGTACPGGTTCIAGSCPPPNDARANATPIVPSLSEVTVMGTTVGASFDGPSVPCACSGTRNVWYRFELTGESVVYFDTFGSSTTDTELHITSDSGTLLPGGLPWVGPPAPGACNNDAPCSGGGWSAGASRTAAILGAGTWNVAVGSCNPGAFTLHMQMIPTSLAQDVYEREMAPGEVEHRLPSGSEGAPMCGEGGSSGEAMHWFLECGGAGEVLLSLCRSDGGRWERNDNLFGPFRDPVMTVYTASTGSDVACVDDAGGSGGIDCRGMTLRVNPVLGLPQWYVDGHHYGPRYRGVVPRGLNAAIVDESESLGGLDYTLMYHGFGVSFP